jgi:hypothetical protein
MVNATMKVYLRAVGAKSQKTYILKGGKDLLAGVNSSMIRIKEIRINIEK